MLPSKNNFHSVVKEKRMEVHL